MFTAWTAVNHWPLAWNIIHQRCILCRCSLKRPALAASIARRWSPRFAAAGRTMITLVRVWTTSRDAVGCAKVSPKRWPNDVCRLERSHPMVLFILIYLLYTTFNTCVFVPPWPSGTRRSTRRRKAWGSYPGKILIYQIFTCLLNWMCHIIVVMYNI